MKFFAKIALPVLATALLMPTAAMASGKLPFVGKRYFDFTFFNVGGTQYITIDKNGNTTIGYMDADDKVIAVAYRGKYKKLMKDNEDGYYYQIKGNKIYQIDGKGRMKYDCWYGSDLCVNNLRKNRD